MTTEERFTSKCQTTTSGCIEWTGTLTTHSTRPELGGYPRFWENGRWVLAHRRQLIRKLGRQLGGGCEADHECHNRRCVNPAHLRELPKADNIREANARRYAR